MAQFNYNLQPVDFFGQYMRGVTFRQAREEAEQRKAKEEELEALREGERREKAMVQDARQLKYLIESGDFKRAQDLGIERLQTLTNSGLDTRDTEQVVGRIIQGDFQGALNDVNGFLSRYGELDAKKPSGPKVGRFRTETIGDKVVMFDSSTGDVVKEWKKPKTEAEQQQIRRDKTRIEKEEKAFEEEKKNIAKGEQQALNAFQRMRNTAKDLIAHPGLEKASGWQSNFPTVGGTDAAGFEKKLDTLKSQTFLAGVEKMRGLGALTGPEGQRLENEIASLDIQQSDEEMKKSLSEIYNYTDWGVNNMERIGRGEPPLTFEEFKRGVRGGDSGRDEKSILAEYGL